jgi:hypothetical protein
MDVDGVPEDHGDTLDHVDPELQQDGADDSGDDYLDPAKAAATTTSEAEAGTDSEDERQLFTEFMKLRKTEKSKAAKKKANPKPAKVK